MALRECTNILEYQPGGNKQKSVQYVYDNAMREDEIRIRVTEWPSDGRDGIETETLMTQGSEPCGHPGEEYSRPREQPGQRW